MKVEVEKQPGSVSTLQIEVPSEEVSKEWDAIANSFAHFAKIPGYRPGKAPRAVIEKRFRKEIQDELTKKLVSKSYHEAIEQEQLRVASLANIEDVQLGEDKSMRFRATVVTAPEFELPEYKNIAVELPETNVSESEVDVAIERLRDQTADFVDVPERGLEMSDFAADFPVKELAAKQASYNVTVREIKQKVLPALDDAFAAKLIPGKTLVDLRQVIDHDLAHEKKHERERAKEGQVVKYLHERIQFELPPALLKSETRRILADLVQRNRERGVTDEMLKDKEKELIESAAGLAAHRLKTNFILHRIAEQENINVSGDDINARLREEAARYNVAVEKIRKELQEHDGLDAFAEQILLGKTLDFLKANVSVETAQEPA